MKTNQRRYPALEVRQTPESPALVLFNAPAYEIEKWAGIPQKKKWDGVETVEFQRNEDRARVDKLSDFLRDQKNVVQNPLLCAIRDRAAVRFEADCADGENAYARRGWLVIDEPILDDEPILELMRRTKNAIEKRMPALLSEPVSPQLVSALKHQLALDDGGETRSDEGGEEEQTTSGVDEMNDAAGAVFSDESHIVDFWRELAVRCAVLEELGGIGTDDFFAGFTREVLASGLKPTVVVDGQHRLRGAVERAVEDADSPDNARRGVELASKHGETKALEIVRSSVSRWLPVSMLMSDDPAEHVFQFVVVNQKATPIGRALLGTIVSTSLTTGELSRVGARLERAKIPLEDARAVNFLAKHPSSPFFNKIERGFGGESDLLQWNVLSGLAKIFRFLDGGRLYHMKPDFARSWRTAEGGLEASAVVVRAGGQSALEAWSAEDGVWRDVFVRFFTVIRKEFGTEADAEASHYWGKPTSSQLFNMVSLTILAADFFRYLAFSGGQSIDSLDHVEQHMQRWLRGVDRTYFSRQWGDKQVGLKGIKKENPGIRKQWARLWYDYVLSPDAQALPKAKDYRSAYAG
jgi:hypothetical protein